MACRLISSFRKTTGGTAIKHEAPLRKTQIINQVPRLDMHSLIDLGRTSIYYSYLLKDIVCVAIVIVNK